MIIVLTSTDAPRLTDLDRFDRLHAELHGAVETARFDELCKPGDDDHVWLDIDAARRTAASVSSDPTYGDQFDAMISYARDSGWVDDAGTHVRAHLQPVG